MSNCRICSTKLNPMMSFGKMPLANGFLTPEQFSTEYFFDMAVQFCDNCKMFQLVDQPAPEAMFHEQYAFFTGTSKGMVAHFKRYAEDVILNYIDRSNNPFVVEIGSNDGTMLENFKQAGIRHLGIEPSENVAEVARKRGINTISKFFGKSFAEEIVSEHGQADVFFAANVMCHIPDFHSVVEGIKALLKPKGVAMFEDPYLGDMIKKTSYDQIYDEHVFIFSLHSIKNVFSMHGLELIDAKPQTTHGGSMRYILAHQGAYTVSSKVKELLEAEVFLGITIEEGFLQFKKNCETSREQLKTILEKLKQENKRVVGYAATSKSTTVLNYCSIGPDLIEFISDTTPIKQGKFSPGVHIPVKAYSEFVENYPDIALLFAWNHAEEIFSKEDNFRASGGKWLMFVPKVEIL